MKQKKVKKEKKNKKDKKYRHSFARKLTRWVMLVLFIMMGALAYFTYELTKEIVIDVCANNFHSSMQSSGGTISNAMSDVKLAVDNNVFDIERNLSQPDQLQTIMERIVDLNPRVRSCGISFIENYYPQKGRNFCPYAQQHDSLQVEKNQKKLIDNNYLEAEWFVEAVAADSAYWSKPFFDSHDAKTPLVAYLQPIHDRQGRVVAILGADLSLDFMTQLLQQQDSIFQKEIASFSISAMGLLRSYVLMHDGTYITHPDKRRILKNKFYDHIKDDEEPGMAQNIINAMSGGMKSHKEVDKQVLVNRSKSFLFYTPLEGTDWMLAVSVPAWALLVIGIILGFLMFLINIVVLLVTFFVCHVTIRHAANPLKELAATADKVANGQFDTPLPAIKSHDEIHLLRDSFENMQHSLTSYVEELKSTTAAKASIESELKIAHDIQMSMLPKTYPAFPDRHDIDIYGLVMPAKAVGGDLYDFFIRDEKLFFCIGDVSGKGVPASLVMAVTRSLFRNISAYTPAPEQIVLALNEALSSNNDANMFVTLFLGVLDLVSGQLSYTNAGHNAPLLLTPTGVSKLACDANIPAGVMSGWQFTVQHLLLKPGDSVFLYTDGLNEAEDNNFCQFGMERMQQVARLTVNQPQPLIEAMTQAVQLFVGDAEQSDDLTMLAVQYTNSTSPTIIK